MSLTRQRNPAGNRRANSETIDWAEYARIVPGEYLAHCYWSKRYRDPGFKRWTCLLRWNVLSEDAQRIIAKCVPLWFALGEGDNPKASRRTKYLKEWVRANGQPPTTGDRLSPNVFTRRIARVEIGDADSPVPYSVVRRIIQWETGPCRHSVSKSTSQERLDISACKRER
jgi:hypothetical protein